MARGRYVEQKPLGFIRALVAFAEGDDTDAYAIANAGRDWLARDVTAALKALKATEIRSLQDDLRGFLRVAAGAPVPNSLSATRVRVDLIPLVGKLRQPTARFAVDGPVRDVLLYQAQTVLANDDRLRCCPASDCRKLFVKVGRREFCSERCQRRVFLSTYNPLAAHPRRPEPLRARRGK